MDFYTNLLNDIRLKLIKRNQYLKRQEVLKQIKNNSFRCKLM